MLTTALVNDVIDRALQEDAPWGDITSQAVVPADARATALMVAREAGVFAGADVLTAAFARVDDQTKVVLHLQDGDRIAAGDVIATIDGNARSLLLAERVALNLVQRMSGIATVTAQYVAAVAGTKARIVDTRKTTAGLRAIEKYSVVCGGGGNHRFSLSDAAMVKDNHLATLGAAGLDVTQVLRDARKRLPHTAHLEVEVDRLDQLLAVLEADVDTVLLDNFSLDDLRTAVGLINGRVLIEASGGVTLDSVAAIAGTGVDIISVGALTHSVRALDIGLDWQ